MWSIWRILTLFLFFQLACKSNREFRACEIAGLMPDERSVSLFIRDVFIPRIKATCRFRAMVRVRVRVGERS